MRTRFYLVLAVSISLIASASYLFHWDTVDELQEHQSCATSNLCESGFSESIELDDSSNPEQGGNFDKDHGNARLATPNSKHQTNLDGPSSRRPVRSNKRPSLRLLLEQYNGSWNDENPLDVFYEFSDDKLLSAGERNKNNFGGLSDAQLLGLSAGMDVSPEMWMRWVEESDPKGGGLPTILQAFNSLFFFLLSSNIFPCPTLAALALGGGKGKN